MSQRAHEIIEEFRPIIAAMGMHRPVRRGTIVSLMIIRVNIISSSIPQIRRTTRAASIGGVARKRWSWLTMRSMMYTSTDTTQRTK